MSTWHQIVQARGEVPEWPYPVRYGQENVVSCDVLIIGGGVAGCHAAVSAAKHGARVVVADRGHAKRWCGRSRCRPLAWSGYQLLPQVTPLAYTLACAMGVPVGIPAA